MGRSTNGQGQGQGPNADVLDEMLGREQGKLVPFNDGHSLWSVLSVSDLVCNN